MALTTVVATEGPQNTKGMVHTGRLAWRFGSRRACMEIQEAHQGRVWLRSWKGFAGRKNYG
jgi:hypothetical protein